MAGEYWDVLYRAVADFGPLIRAAAEAKAALEALGKTSKDLTDSQIAGETNLIAARKGEIQALKDEASAATVTGDAYKRYNQQALYGGRSDMDAHLADLQKELQYKTLLNRQEWLGFTTPQQAYAWRQQEYTQRLLMNRAEWAGYSTADQYIGYLQRQTSAYKDLNTEMIERAGLYKQLADNALAYANALRGTHETLGQIGEAGSVAGISALNEALTGLPAEITTQVTITGVPEALAELAAYRAALADLPGIETTVVSSLPVNGGGGAPTITINVDLNTDEAKAKLAELCAELNMYKDFTVKADFDDTEAMAKAEAFNAWLKAHDKDTVSVFEQVMTSTGGAAGGGGGPPPPPSPGPGYPDEEPDPNEINAAAAAEGNLAKALTAEALAAHASSDANKANAASALAIAAASDVTNAATKDTASKFQLMGIAFTDATTAGWGLKLMMAGGLLPSIAVWHIALDGIFELLAVIIPAITVLTVGLGAFVAAGILSGDTLGKIHDRMVAVYEASTATGMAIYPLTQNFDKLQNVIRPEWWQLFGDAINLVNTKMGTFGNVAELVGRAVDTFAARIEVDLSGAGKGMHTFVSVGLEDLQKLGELFATLGNVFMNFIKVMNLTHVDQYLLDILIAGAKLLDLITKLPAPLLAVAVGAHAVWLWGGLLATIFLQMINPLRALALWLGGVTAEETALATVSKDSTAWQILSANIRAIGAGFAGMGAQITMLLTRMGLLRAANVETAASAGVVEDATMAEAASLEATAVAATEAGAASSAAAGASGIGGLLAVLGSTGGLIGIAIAAAAALAVVGVKLGMMHDATMTWLTDLGSTLNAASIFKVVGVTMQQLAAVTIELANAQKTGQGNATELASGQRSLNQELQAELTHVGGLSKAYGTNFVGALELLNTAGVKTSSIFSTNNKTWEIAQAQVAGLVTGYKAMGQGLNQLQGDVSVQLVTQSDQLAAMQKLNGQWDTWLQLVEAGPTALVPYLQSVQTLDTDLAAAGASMGGLNANSLTARATFTQMIPQMGTIQDSIRQYSAVLQLGAAGSMDLDRGTKDIIASSGLLSSTNKQVQDSLIAVAEEAEPSINTWQKLTQWVGKKGAAGAAQDLDNLMTQLETPMSNLSADAQKIGESLQNDLNPAMAQAIFNAQGGQQAFNNFADAYEKFGSDAPQTVNAARGVAQELLAIDGNSATAKEQFVGFAEAMGMSKSQADAMWKSLTTGKDAVTATSKAADKLRESMGQATAATAKLGTPGLWGQIEHVFMAAFDGMANWFTNSFPHAFEVAWDSIFNWFAVSVPHAFNDVWEKIWTNMVEPVRKGFDQVEQFVATSFDSWWKTHGKEVKEIWNTIWTGLSDVANAVWPVIEQGAINFWNNLVGIFTDTSLWDKFKNAGVDVWRYFAPAARDFGSVVSLVFTGIGHVANTIWDGILATWKVLWSLMVAVAKIAWDAIVFIINEVLDIFTGHWHQAWTDLLTFATQVWNAIGGVVVTFLAQVKSLAYATWRLLFQPVVGFFDTMFYQPIFRFFDSTMPGWLDDIGRKIRSTWQTAWTDFDDSVIVPMGRWFSNTLPSTIEGAFKNSVNWVITNVLNRTIGIINDVTSVVGIPKIPSVATLAAGGTPASQLAGSVPGPADSDNYFAKVMGGEYVIRQPARMALEATYGRGFMNYLNQFDSVSGSGSRGILASQGWAAGGMMPGYAGGGPVDSVLGGVLGFLNPAGLLTGAARGLAGMIGGGLGEITKLLGLNSAAEDIFNGVWDFSAGKLLDLVPEGNAVGDFTHYLGNSLKHGVDSVLGAKDSAAAADIASLAGPATSFESATDFANLLTVARYLVGAGLTKAAAAGVASVVAGESGGDPEAVGDGGFGLIGWTPPGSANDYFPGTWPLSGDASADLDHQLRAMVGYMNANGGSGPLNAQQNPVEAGDVWSARYERPLIRYSDTRPDLANEIFADIGHASGGEIAAAVKAITSVQRIRESMLMGSYLESGFNDNSRDGQYYGPFMVGLGKKPKTARIRNAETPAWAARLALPYYRRAFDKVNPEMWKNDSGKDAALAVANLAQHNAVLSGDRSGFFKYNGAAEVTDGWYQALDLLGEGSRGRETTESVYAATLLKYEADAAATEKQWDSFYGSLNVLLHEGRPGKPHEVSNTVWDAWKADRDIMDRSARLMQGGIRDMQLGVSHVDGATWNDFFGDPMGLSMMSGLLAGKVPPPKYWGGKTHPSGALLNKLWDGPSDIAQQRLQGFGLAARTGYGEWAKLMKVMPPGPQPPPVIPGTVRPPIPTTAKPVNILPYAMLGGPGAGATPGGDMGFAAGGTVGLSDVAGMFAMNMPFMGGVLPVAMPPGVVSSMSKASEMPRTMSAAASASGNRVGLNVESLVVNNPVPEPASMSITRANTRLGFLAGRGAV